jgi:hypothetical protein
MLVVFGFALLVLAGAVVVLFAMLAELASRVPQPEPPWVQPLEEARLGHVPAAYPADLADDVSEERHVLLVLSTVCQSCQAIAVQLVEDHADWADVALVISTADRRNGEDFVARHKLGRFTYYIDEGGDWVSGEFGVQTSPTALVLRNGRLASAYAFSDVATLRSAVTEEGERDKEKEAV